MFRKIAVLVIGVVTFTLSFQTVAVESQQQRKLYLDAEKKLWQPKSSQYRQLYNQLHYYPLQPYLDQQELMHTMSLSKATEISTFLEKYRGTPLDWPLRKKWLNYLSTKKRKALFLTHYIPTSSAELTCQFYEYQLDAGLSPDKVLPKVTKLWVHKKSQPKVCDPLFAKWQKAGYRTESVVWQRIELSADGGDHTLLRYLGTLLPQDQQYLAGLWKSVRTNPSYITKLDRFPNKTEREIQILSYGLKRLIWRDPNLAIKTFDKAQQTIAFTVTQKAEITFRFALALASKTHTEADDWLKKVDDTLVDKSVAQWRIANVLQTNDWELINEELLSLPEEKQTSLQWQYWYGRSLMQTGNLEKGNVVLGELAKKRHYYGFLAAGHVKQTSQFQDNPLQATEAEKASVLKFPAAKRAFELFHLGRYNQARREWNYWLTKLNDREKLVAAKIANEKEWFDRAIFALSGVGYLDDVDLRFPLAFDQPIKQQSKHHNINPAWAFAIARRESSFMSDANSSVGAKGLMQVMPNTAKQLKKKKVSTKYLLNAKNNIALGTQYLSQLLARYQGNAILATASYNAGPYRVSRWIKERPELPADMWIETIPYKETREYVKSVLAYQQIYEHKVGHTTQLFEQVINTQIGN